ncbi:MULTISPECIES: response regulator transcription factor [unclassified Paenibacillus]|uniref:response regulator transcription factor n=1 Tax=unclassified Paenibacillus TaxID=185978 RepID=UPI001C11C8D6|nr:MULTISPECIES: response regulator transcription factor [unclassified Paenibacillus]MBU5443588.1 response regulator transcription factor [Paenibacillus sp. MSJ-34]CAH0119979.1 Transcriptional regulatory protein LiaR [Paenibacillus sp. CECT 9249]
MLDCIRVLLVMDDDPRFTELLSLLRREPGFEVSVTNLNEVKQHVARGTADVILLSSSQHSLFYAGLKTAGELLRQNPVKIIVLTTIHEKEAVLDAFTAGVLNYLLNKSYRDIPAAIREAHLNRSSLHPDVAALLRQEIKHFRHADMQQRLTRTEKQVLHLLAEGCTRTEISETLQVSPNTVKFHMRNLIQKIGGATGKEAAERAKRMGYL